MLEVSNFNDLQLVEALLEKELTTDEQAGRQYRQPRGDADADGLVARQGQA